MPAPTLTISPPAHELLSLARARFATITDEHRRLRSQLGLPLDRPIVMSGHQLAIWHPGILAKWLFTAAAGEHDAAGAWVWVDQDANAFGELRYPVRLPEPPAEGALEARAWRFTPTLTGHQPVAAMPPFAPAPLPATPRAAYATAEVGPALERIRAALVAGGNGAASAAEQMHRALIMLLAPIAPEPPHLVMATRLAHTDLFSRLVERMRERPRACTDAYNAAVAAFPDGHAAEVAMLHTGVNHPRGAELPLWHIPPGAGAARSRVHAADLSRTPVHELAPRGLFMTGLLRLAACDVFIHGTGGGGRDGYDRITDLWFARWLGESIAPTAVVTATLHLDLARDRADPADLARARWLAHHARHHPSLIGDPDAAERKRATVREIAALPRHDPRRSLLFRRMHAQLETTRIAHAAQLAELEAQAQRIATRLQDAAVAAERTWPFPLYPHDLLAELRGRIHAELAPPAATLA